MHAYASKCNCLVVQTPQTLRVALNKGKKTQNLSSRKRIYALDLEVLSSCRKNAVSRKLYNTAERSKGEVRDRISFSLQFLFF